MLSCLSACLDGSTRADAPAVLTLVTFSRFLPVPIAAAAVATPPCTRTPGLLKVVERAVIAAGMDDDEWRVRLERGQKLAREAESNRRDSRDAQRSAEDTIAKQAAELEKLREEAKSRAPGRRPWRSCEVS